MKLKYLGLFAAFALLLGTTACDELNPNNGSDDNNETSEGYKGCGPSDDNSPITVTVTGDIDIDLDNAELVGKEGSVSFNHFPNTLSQFESVLPTLKETPQGAVAAQLMAMELFRRVPSAGEQAFYLCNVKSNVSSIMQRLPDLFGFTGMIDDYDEYIRPYQVASFLQGANRDNGYTPSEPYTVNVRVSRNGAVYSETYQAKVLYLEVITEGNDQGSTPVQVVNTKKKDEPSGWIIFNCAGLYAQCKAISFDEPFKGLK